MQLRPTWPETVAVYIVLGWGPKDGDILAPPGDWAPTLLRNRYIRLWIYRHRYWPADQLIATLVEAVDIARERDRDIVLPEWPAEPTAGQAGDPPPEASSA